MIHLLGKVPRKVNVAVSGGVDSMTLLEFLRNNHEVRPAFVHHGTGNSERAYEFLVSRIVGEFKMPLSVYKIQTNKPKGLSWEEHWRNERYKFFSTLGPVVTAHTLDDVAETWIWSSLNGCSSLMPYSHGNVIRPLLLTRKEELLNYTSRKDIKWVNDTSNNDNSYTRNYIRHELMPHALRVNPGLHSMLRKKLVERQRLLD